MARTYPPPVVAERFVAALDGHDPIDSMRKAPKRLKKLLRGISEKELVRAPALGKWSVHQVLAHLASGELMLGTRLRLVAAMDEPRLVGYDQDAFVARLGYEQVPSEALLGDFAALRAMNVALLERLPQEAWARIGLHDERGPESLSTMVHMYAGHDRVHELQIEATRSAVRSLRRAKKGGEKKSGAEKRR